MTPSCPYTPQQRRRYRLRRHTFTVAVALFVVGGMVGLVTDDEPVAFALPEPPARPQVDPILPGAPSTAPQDDFDNAMAHLMANLGAEQ